MRDDVVDESEESPTGEGGRKHAPSQQRGGEPSWHRGETTNLYPSHSHYFDRSFLRDYVLEGWMPETPVLTRGTKITAFGSCFAANITRHLDNLGYDLSSKRDPDIHISRIGDGLVNTASILGQFEWALEDKKQPGDMWHGFKAEGFGYDEDIRLRTREIFLGTEFFIITLGLSEVWYDEVTGGTFWRAVPWRHFDPTRHKFRVMSMADTKRDIAHIHALIRKHVPGAKILFTVSPIPLAATFRPVSCLTANTVSKAILRAALDEFLREMPDELNRTLFYFPSLEIVQQGFMDANARDNRHPLSYVLDVVMKTFEAVYCVDEGTLDDAAELFLMFRARNVEDLAARKPDEFERAVALREAGKAARSVEKAGIEARRQAKQREVSFNKVPAAKAKTADEKAERIAQREKRKEKRRARRRAERDGEEEE
jgi:GSCFA family